jgi:hypothetical protein
MRCKDLAPTMSEICIGASGAMAILHSRAIECKLPLDDVLRPSIAPPRTRRPKIDDSLPLESLSSN